MPHKGEWKHGVYIPVSDEEAHQIWREKRGHSKSQIKRLICVAAEARCECCSIKAVLEMGMVHHRNGNKTDFDRKNLIWLCDRCYVQVNGLDVAATLNMSKLKAELT